MFLIFIQKVLDSAILNTHKIQSPSLPQLKKKVFVRVKTNTWNGIETFSEKCRSIRWKY